MELGTWSVCYAGLFDTRESYVGTSAAQILKLGAGNAEAMAQGRSYVALADGVESMNWNPAGLARSNNREASVGLISWVDDMKGHFIGYNHPFMHSNLGLSGAYVTMGDFDVRDVQGLPLSGQSVFVRMGYLNASFAWSLPSERFYLGAGAKAVFEDLYESNSAYTAADVGLLWLMDGNWQFGASMLNLGIDAQDIPWSFRGGAAYNFPELVTLSADYIQDRDSRARVGAGLIIDFPEIQDLGIMSLRVGYYTADNQGESSLGFLKNLKLHQTSGLSYGLGMDSMSESLHHMSLDYALVPLGALGTAHLINVKFRF
ncbi:MAG: hypothetical protein HY547_07560 [Elusimicrobia bacterium]|nr:hypothetical protein [Elusimicrobiota bacterium]